MREQVVRCDGCGKQKGATNHWYIVGVWFRGDDASKIIVYLGEGEPLDSSADDSQDFCGEQCLIAFISQQLTKQTKETDG